MEIYLRLLATAMIPVVLSVGFYLLQNCTTFGRIKYWIQQVIIGLIFGAVAVYGTAFGVDIGGAAANARDAAPLCAGLFFGGPAGIIAGTIGGVFRWLYAEIWHIGEYTKIACSVSTFVAGIYAAVLREIVFDKKSPKWVISFLVGVIIEAFHMIMVFFTHSGDATQALEVVKICTFPMILANSVAIALAAALIQIVDRAILYKQSGRHKNRKPTISEKVQLTLLIIVVISFLLTSAFSYVLQTNQTNVNTEKVLRTSIQDLVDDVSDISDRKMMEIVEAVAKEYNTGEMRPLEQVAQWYGVTEINIVDPEGIITDSTNSSFVGYDMKSADQSRPFMELANSNKKMVQQFTRIGIDSRIQRKYAGASVKDGGYVQIGCDDKTFYEKVSESMETVAKNRHVGNTGYMMVIDPRNTIVSCPDDSMLGRNLMSTGLWIWDGHDEMTIYNGELRQLEENVFYMFMTAEGYRIIAVYPEKEAMNGRDFNVYMNSFSQILIFAFLFAAIYFSINSVVLKRLRKVNGSLEKITGGDLNEVVDVRNTEEFDKLSDEINTTVDRLKEYIAEAAARIDAELEFAKNIQLSALPSDFPAFPEKQEFDIYATMDAAKEVGGDFYDFYMPENNKLAFLIADVSGKGIPAAMFMMQAKTMINGFISAGLNVDKAFTMSNDKLCEHNEAEMFVTAWQGILDIDTGHVEFANAGHNPPVLYRKGEGWCYLKSKVGFVLAGMEGINYKVQDFDFNPGDKIFLYTDGIVEAQNLAQELYGEDRLLAYLNDHCEDGPEEVLKGVRANVDAFVGEAEQFDDMTMLMVEYYGPGDIKANKL